MQFYLNGCEAVEELKSRGSGLQTKIINNMKTLLLVGQRIEGEGGIG